jgi:hypothetical protein
MKGGMRILGWTQDDSERLLYECHEGNYGLKNSLSAARAEERAEK